MIEKTISKLLTAYQNSVQHVYNNPIEPVTTLSFRCGGRGCMGVIRTTITKLPSQYISAEIIH